MNRAYFQQVHSPSASLTLARGGIVISIIGNKSGLKTKQLRQLERLGQKKVSPDEVIGRDMARAMTA
ncbi:hypothetical protein VU03_02295, partial [Desulfobulbus sp. N3]|nr:hypothetical protein [Desulfobulbus sp. N3]